MRLAGGVALAPRFLIGRWKITKRRRHPSPISNGAAFLPRPPVTSPLPSAPDDVIANGRPMVADLAPTNESAACQLSTNPNPTKKLAKFFKKKETTNYSRRRRQIGSLPIRRRRRRRLMISDGGSLTNAEPPSSYANEPRQRRPISSDPIEFRVPPPPPPPPISSVARPPGLPSFYRVFYAD